MLELVNFSERAAGPPARAVGGQQQRVALARALVNMPALLAAGRAARRAGSQAAPPDAGRAEDDPAGDGDHLRVRDPRSGRGADDVGPDRGHEPRPVGAGRRPPPRSTSDLPPPLRPALSVPPTCSPAGPRATTPRSTASPSVPFPPGPRSWRDGDSLLMAIRPEKLFIAPPEGHDGPVLGGGGGGRRVPRGDHACWISAPAADVALARRRVPPAGGRRRPLSARRPCRVGWNTADAQFFPEPTCSIRLARACRRRHRTVINLEVGGTT